MEWQTPPEIFTQEEREEWLKELNGVALSSDAFFPFVDNVLRANRSGVKYIAAPMGSQMDTAVTQACSNLGITCKYTACNIGETRRSYLPSHRARNPAFSSLRSKGRRCFARDPHCSRSLDVTSARNSFDLFEDRYEDRACGQIVSLVGSSR